MEKSKAKSRRSMEVLGGSISQDLFVKLGEKWMWLCRLPLTRLEVMIMGMGNGNETLEDAQKLVRELEEKSACSHVSDASDAKNLIISHHISSYFIIFFKIWNGVLQDGSQYVSQGGALAVLSMDLGGMSDVRSLTAVDKLWQESLRWPLLKARQRIAGGRLLLSMRRLSVGFFGFQRHKLPKKKHPTCQKHGAFQYCEKCQHVNMSTARTFAGCATVSTERGQGGQVDQRSLPSLEA